ncbi:hypothetical protein PMAYCL1PPCAC_11370, partial [Pristionchus mayeri]
SQIPVCFSAVRTARESSPSSSDQDRTARSKRKKWTVNSVVSKAGARTPERYDRARTMRSLSTARNLSFASPANMKTARTRSRSPNGEIPAPVQTIPIVPTPELGPHGECQLVEGMELLKCAAPVDSLIRTCAEGVSPPRTRSESNCSTANGIRTCESTNEYCANKSPPFSSPRSIPCTDESRACTPLRTARNASPCLQQRAPSSAALDKRRVLFGYGTRPATTPTRSARQSASPAQKTCIDEASPMHTAQRIVMSPVQTAVRVAPSSRSSNENSRKSLKQIHKESNRSQRDKSAAKARLERSSTSTANLPTARNLFGTVAANESVASMLTARTPNMQTGRKTQSPTASMKTARHQSPKGCTQHERDFDVPRLSTDHQPLRLEDWSQYDGKESNFGKHGPTERSAPYRPLPSQGSDTRTARLPSAPLNTARTGSPYGCFPSVRTAAERSPARDLTTARNQTSPMSRRVPQPRQLFGDVLTAPPADSPYAPAQEGTMTARSPMQSLKTARQSPYDKNVITGREARSPMQPLQTARHKSPYGGNVQTACEARTPNRSCKTARASPYEKNVLTAREPRSPAHSMKTARASPYGKSARSPALQTARQPAHDARSIRELHTPDRSCKTARASPYNKSARSPALNTAMLSPYERNVLTARAAQSPSTPMKTAAARERSERTARSPADGLRTAADYGRSPALPTARCLSPKEGPRSVYLAPQMAPLNAEARRQEEGYKQMVTARVVTPCRSSRGI